VNEEQISAHYSSMHKAPPGIDRLWIEHQRRNYKAAESWACVLCPDRKFFLSVSNLWDHALRDHHDILPSDTTELARYRIKYIADSSGKRSVLPFNYWCIVGSAGC
jgi:hypothetical protein